MFVVFSVAQIVNNLLTFRTMEWWYWILLPIAGFATLQVFFLLLALLMHLIKKWNGDNRKANEMSTDDSTTYFVIAMIILSAIIWWLDEYL